MPPFHWFPREIDGGEGKGSGLGAARPCRVGGSGEWGVAVPEGAGWGGPLRGMAAHPEGRERSCCHCSRCRLLLLLRRLLLLLRGGGGSPRRALPPARPSGQSPGPGHRGPCRGEYTVWCVRRQRPPWDRGFLLHPPHANFASVNTGPSLRPEEDGIRCPVFQPCLNLLLVSESLFIERYLSALCECVQVNSMRLRTGCPKYPVPGAVSKRIPMNTLTGDNFHWRMSRLSLTNILCLLFCLD